MTHFRSRLPQLGADVFLTDGGIETTLIFDDGFDLPDFAAFVLLDDPAGRRALERYFAAYAELAAGDGVGVVLETPTWRASVDWGARLGYDADAMSRVNRDAVELLVATRATYSTATSPIVISGCIGPRGDGYQVGAVMSPAEAQAYHALQVRAFSASAADLVTAITMTYVDEAIGVVEAARAAEMPVVISFTVETDGRLPSGEPLGAAIGAVDAATGDYPSYYMVNCAHPTHFAPIIDAALAGGEGWVGRLGGVRANASTLSHAELDEATELDRGDPADLAARYRDLRTLVPNLRVLGGCCGTDHHHVGAIIRACAGHSV